MLFSSCGPIIPDGDLTELFELRRLIYIYIIKRDHPSEEGGRGPFDFGVIYEYLHIERGGRKT
jgi:hypothetical protein